jgi:hypothetical protein
MIARVGRALRSPGMVAFGVLAAAYGVVIGPSERAGAAFSIDGVLSITAHTSTSPQFESFVVLPAWMLYLVGRSHYSLGDIRRIRHGSYWRSAVANCGAGLAVIGAGAMVTVLASACSTLILGGRSPARGEFASAGSTTPSSIFECALVVLCEFAALALALTILELGTEALAARGRRPIPVVAVLLSVWIWGALSASGFVPSDSLSCMNEYLSVGLASRFPGLAFEALVVELGVGIAFAAFIRTIDSRTIARSPARSAIPLVTALALVASCSLTLTGSGEASHSVFVATSFLLSGSSGTIVTALVAIVVYVGYAFAFQSRARRELDGWAPLALIRHGSMGRFVRSTMTAETVRVVAYIGGIAACSIVAYVIVGGRDFAAGGIDVGLWTYQLVANGVLQVLVYVLITLGALLHTGSRLAGLAIVGVLAALVAAPLPSNALVPIQLSRQSSVSEGWPFVLGASGVLIGTLVVLYAALVILLRRPIPRTR